MSVPGGKADLPAVGEDVWNFPIYRVAMWLNDDGWADFLKRKTALLLQSTITPRFSGQRQAGPDQQMVAIAASLACPMRFKFWTQICLPTQFTLGRADWGRVRLSVLGY